jgi:hypothetical protein
MKRRIMYIECKSDGLTGPARIGRVTFSKSGKSSARAVGGFETLAGRGDHYWISGCKRDGIDHLYGERLPVEIDDDVRVEYWTEIRKQAESTSKTVAN